MLNKNFKSVIALILSVMMTATSVFAAPSMAGVVGGVEESVEAEVVVDEATLTEETESETTVDTWDGTLDISWYNEVDDEFTLTTAEQYAGFAYLVNGFASYSPAEKVIPADIGYYSEGNKLYTPAESDAAKSISFDGKTVKLGVDLDMCAVYKEGEEKAGEPVKLPGNEPLSMMPVGFSQYTPFKGTFDGQNHTIKNIFQGMWDAIGYPSDGFAYYISLGVFGNVVDGTVKNLVVENLSFNAECRAGGLVGKAGGTSSFENITLKNCKVAAGGGWQFGGLIGWAYGNITIDGFSIDETNTVGAQGGNYDASVGGIIGGCNNVGGESITFKNCDVSCRLDVYNDCTANYDTGVYRNCGMVIGAVGESQEVTIDGKLYPDFTSKNITFDDVEVSIGDWANYTYCWSYALNHNCQRIEPGVGYNGVDVTTVGDYSVTRRRFDAIFGAENAGDLNNVRKEVDYKTMNFLHSKGLIDATTITVVAPEVITLDGKGTKENPYLINNLDDLKMFRDAVNAGMTYEGEYFLLTADIDLTGEVWTPIGTSNYDRVPANATMFAGNFDGGNHTITGLSSEGYVPAAYETESTEYSFGLFGYVYGSNISNVKLAAVDIDCGTIVDSLGRNVTGSGVAALIGYYHPVNEKVSVIENCHVLGGEVKASNNMGGLIGHMDTQLTQPALDITIKNCSNAADVTTEAREAGGILGLMNSAREGNYLVTARGSVVFENCVNAGNITSLGGGAPSAGGILGRDHNQAAGQRLKVIFDGCENSGTITVTANGETHAAGIAAGFYSTGAWLIADKCVNTGDVVVTNANNSDVYAGGLISYGGVVEVIDSKSTGNVTGGTANNKYVGDAHSILFLEKMYDCTDTINGYTYYLNGGTSPEYAALVDDAAGGGNFHLVEKAYKDGFEFVGWYDNPKFEGNAYTKLSSGVKKYYAKWYGTVAKIGTVEFKTFDDALDAASAMTGDVTVEIYDKVTLNKPLLGSYDTIKFIGMNDDAEIYLDVTGYTTATGKKVAFEKLNLSKSNTGGHVANAGFMNVAFGLYDVVEVSYTDCVLLNGAYASSGKVTFTGCTFHSSYDRYGLWAYGSQDITVDGCTFASVRGIKVYDEGKQKLSVLKVNDTDFSKADGKPAIVLTSGKSVTLIGDNKYPSTGVFELDLDGNPDGTPVTVDAANLAALKCVNDDGDCGVLVNGKIYTTLAKADDAGVILAGTEVTLLHNSVVPVELPRGVKFTENGYTASNVTYEASNGTLTYVFTSTTGFWGEGTANAVDSFVVELYEEDKKIASASLSDSYIDGDVYVTWSIPFVTSTGGAWTVNWETGYPNAFMNPTKGVLVADGVAVAENIIKYSGADDVAPIVAIAKTANGVKAYTSFDAMELDASSITALKLMKSYTVDAGEEFTFNNTEFKAVNGAKVTVLGTLNINGASMTNMIIEGTGKLKLFGTVNFYGKNEVIPTVLEGAPFNLIVNKDATLLITRFVLGYDRSIEVYGNIADAHNFDPTGVTPSLKFNSTSGVSIGGTGTGDLTVENAYVELGSSSWKTSKATHEWSFTNSYVSATSFGNCNAPGADTASWTVTFDNSVLAAKNYIKTGKNVTYNFTNNSVATTGSLRNDGTVYIDETSSLTTTGQQNNVVGAVDEHGGNNGAIKVAGVMTIASNAKTQFEMLGGSLELVGGTVNLGNNSLTLDAASMLTSTGTKAGVINGDIVSEVPALELDNITVNGNVTAKSGEISIIDGTFGGALSGNVKVFGGMYKEDPTAYLAENTVANYRTTSKYWVVDKARTLYLVPVYGEDYTVKTSTEFTVEVYVDGVEPKGVRWDLAFNENYFELVSFTVNQGTNYGTATKPELIAERGTMNTELAVATYVFKSKNIAVNDSPFTVSNVDIRTVENAWEETDVSGTITDEDTRISVENRTMTAVVYDGAEVVTATAIEVQHDPNKIFDMCVKAYEEVNGTNVELTDAQITYTFKHSGTSETLADLPEFSDVGYYDVSYVIKKDGYTTVEGRFTVNIKYNQYVVEVKFDGEVLTTDNKKINYTGDAYKFEVTSTPNAKITYSVNGAAATETAPEITEVGNYVIEYTVEGSASIGYQQVTKKVEITVLAPNYLVEVVFGEESDYVSGTKLVLVYTNASGVTFDFDGVKMLDVSNAGYTYLNRGETHKYVYALVVDAFKYGTTLDMYKAEITLDYENEASKIDYTVKEDVNLNGSVTWNDIISAYTVVEYDKYAFENQMEGFIKADTNRDKKATSADATPIINVVYGK